MNNEDKLDKLINSFNQLQLDFAQITANQKITSKNMAKLTADMAKLTGDMNRLVQIDSAINHLDKRVTSLETTKESIIKYLIHFFVGIIIAGALYGFTLKNGFSLKGK